MAALPAVPFTIITIIIIIVIIAIVIIAIINLQVWQYYLLPPEEQRMPGVKNPMCNAFPRIGTQFIIIGVDKMMIWSDDICIINIGVNHWW